MAEEVMVKGDLRGIRDRSKEATAGTRGAAELIEMIVELKTNGFREEFRATTKLEGNSPEHE